MSSHSEPPCSGPPTGPTAPNTAAADHGPSRPLLACLLPLVVFLACGTLEPATGEPGNWLGLGEGDYPIVYTVRILASLAALAVVARDVLPWLGRPSWWPPLLGVALVIPWIVLAGLQREAGWVAAGSRAAFDPFRPFLGETGSWAFLAVRFTGLVLVVPLAEELFLRCFLMRYVVSERFWEVRFGTLTTASVIACTAYAVLTHPGEAIAAAGWFGIVSGVAAATRRPIDAITTHAATNLALGVYVVATGAWWLW
jgi:CAAX prenyl protease-like protein